MYKFEENNPMTDSGRVCLVGKNKDKLFKAAIKHLDGYYPKDEPKGVWELQKRFGAIVEKFTGDVGGWITKVKEVK